MCLETCLSEYLRMSDNSLIFSFNRVSFSHLQWKLKKKRRKKKQNSLLVHEFLRCDRCLVIFHSLDLHSHRAHSQSVFSFSPLQWDISMWLCSRKWNVSKSGVLLQSQHLQAHQVWFSWGCFFFQQAGMETTWRVALKKAEPPVELLLPEWTLQRGIYPPIKNISLEIMWIITELLCIQVIMCFQILVINIELLITSDDSNAFVIL